MNKQIKQSNKTCNTTVTKQPKETIKIMRTNNKPIKTNKNNKQQSIKNTHITNTKITLNRQKTKNKHKLIKTKSNKKNKRQKNT